MDGNNTHNTSNNISTYSKHKGKVYKGPTKDGQHVKKGCMFIVIDLTEQNLIIDTGQKNILELM